MTNTQPGSNILILSAAAGLYVKILVDIIRLEWPEMQDWIAPLIAIFGGIAIVFMIQVSEGIVITSQVAAQSVLAGFLAGGGAITATSVQKKATEVRATRLAARTQNRQRIDIEAVPKPATKPAAKRK